MKNQQNDESTRTIDQIRKDGLDKQTLERIVAEGVSIGDKWSVSVYLFTGAYEKIQMPGKETEYRFEAYDTTQPIMDDKYEKCWFSIGINGATQIFYWLAQRRSELLIEHNGDFVSQKTVLIIYPYEYYQLTHRDSSER